MKIRILQLILLLFTTSYISSQTNITIGIVKDADIKEFNEFSTMLQKEVTDLISSANSVHFKELSADWDTTSINTNISQLVADPEIDYIIALGYLSSRQLSKLKNYSKPSIATTILDDSMLNLPRNKDNTTGVNNFTYIESIIDMKHNIKEYSQIFDTKNIVVITPDVLINNFPEIDKYLNNNKTKLNISIISTGKDCSKAANLIPAGTDAAIVLPLVASPRQQIKDMLDGLNQKHIPSLAVQGISYLELGATMTMTPELTFQQLARQTALRVLKISEGINPSKIPVSIVENKQVSIINMESLRKIGKFPKWNVLNESILINVTDFSTGKNLNLRMAISEALENNLKSKMSTKDVAIADKEVRIAKASLYPQISVGGNIVGLSNNIVEAAMGQKGRFTLNGSASLKKVIFSESVMANIAINKLMAENKRFFNDQTVLDVVTNTSATYISLLFAKSNLLIQNENVNTTMKNLQMARVKEKAGQTGVSDVNRWITELNMNKMKFNDAYTSYRNSMFNINRQLNIDINATINISDSNNIGQTILPDSSLMKLIFENPRLTDRYASFIIEEMKKNSPEIHQLEKMAEILERKNKLYKRQWFMPEISAVAKAEQAFIRNGTVEPLGMPVPPPPDDMTFSGMVNLSIPIFQGGKASAQAKKTIIEIDKLNDQKDDLYNNLEAGIRKNVQKLRTSYLELELSKNAAKAAEDNFKMVQDAYFQGAVNLIQLLDAQNMMTKTKHSANIAYYQYVLDYLMVERYQGNFSFLNTSEEQEDYIKRLQHFLLNQ